MIEELLKNWNIGEIDTIEPAPQGGGWTWFVKAKSEMFCVEGRMVIH